MWRVSSRSGVATLRTAIHLLLTYLLTQLDTAVRRYEVLVHSCLVFVSRSVYLSGRVTCIAWMRPIDTRAARSMVGLSVLATSVSPAKTDEPMDIVLKSDSCGPNELRIK